MKIENDRRLEKGSDGKQERKREKRKNYSVHLIPRAVRTHHSTNAHRNAYMYKPTSANVCEHA